MNCVVNAELEETPRETRAGGRLGLRSPARGAGGIRLQTAGTAKSGLYFRPKASRKPPVDLTFAVAIVSAASDISELASSDRPHLASSVAADT
ncbi:hypothetical protein NU219Hw_g2315t1 [Hortaea werneckii]